MGKKAKEQKAKEAKKQDFIKFLEEKKARDGKLSKLGEWLLMKGDTGFYVREEDMKYILK